MKFKKSITTLLFIFSSTIQAAQPLGSDDVIQFQKEQHFLRGLVGFAGHLSNSDLRFQRILKKPNAEKIFEEVIYSENSSSAAKVYSICGLSILKSAKLERAIFHLAKNQSPVSTMSGDILRKEKLSTLVNRISKHGC